MKSDGTAWAWGSNLAGQLGDGTKTDRSSPVQVSGITGVSGLAAGEYSSYALKGDGTVWGWGTDAQGQLARPSGVESTTPIQITTLSGITAITSGDRHALALKSDGAVMAWGANDYGQVGNGATSMAQSTPVQVTGLTGVTAIDAGQGASIALKSDGTVWTWGVRYGEGKEDHSPVQVSGLTGVVAVASGNDFYVAVKSDGSVWTWGGNTYCQLGDGTYVNKASPVQVTGLQTSRVYLPALIKNGLW